MLTFANLFVFQRCALFASAMMFGLGVFAGAPPEIPEAQEMQRRIERVLHDHRLWPAENPGGKPSFETRLPPTSLPAMAAARLEQESEYLRRGLPPLTDSALQAEVERMKSYSGDPALLARLFAALENDERLIRDYLAKPLLIERRLAGAVDSAPRADAPAAVCDTWTAMADGSPWLVSRSGATSVWTGVELIVWGGVHDTGTPFPYLNSGGRYTPATDSWSATSLSGPVPDVRGGHRAVWTGSEMLIWGGRNQLGYPPEGGRYNPAGNTWSAMTQLNQPAQLRDSLAAVWTGSEMIVWGGFNYSVPGTWYQSGGRYNPASNSWRSTSLTNAPSPRSNAAAVWSGKEMIIWGGFFTASGGIFTYPNSGGRYNPFSDSWIPTATAGAPVGRTLHSGVWNGAELMVWGGYGNNPGTTVFQDGGRYNPTTDGWSAIPAAGAPAARQNHAAVWSGSELIIHGGDDSAGIFFNTGGRYSIDSNLWQPLSTGVNSPGRRTYHNAVWTGSRMLIWGGQNEVYLPIGGRYEPGYPVSPGDSLRVRKQSGVTLTWSAVAGASSYNVRACNATPGFCYPAALVATPLVNSYSEPAGGGNVFYAVEAVNNCGAAP